MSKDQLSRVEYSLVRRRFLIQTVMSIEKSIELARDAKAVPADKFDRHMRRARVQDTESRAKAFAYQTEVSVERKERLGGIVSSVY